MAGRDGTAPRDGSRTDRAVAAERAAGMHRDVGDDRAVDRHRAAIDRRRAGIAAVASEVQRAAAGFGEAAIALDFAGEFAVLLLIDGQGAGADDDGRLPAARQAADRLVAAAEVERAAADVEVDRKSTRLNSSH